MFFKDKGPSLTESGVNVNDSIAEDLQKVYPIRSLLIVLLRELYSSISAHLIPEAIVLLSSVFTDTFSIPTFIHFILKVYEISIKPRVMPFGIM